ncbi:G kinase-anchoring protein 1-B-like [Watersipora subatra]|uniref:G kinase-anchoring protein 1-B-like n=1 Tax=Watersipora subatra TaxID=2589382 RepID=UPI00355BA449
MAASVTASRFALLKIEGSDDDDASRETHTKTKDSRSKSAAKKKNKKKQTTESANLRSLAFGGGGGKSGGSRSNNVGGSSIQEAQFQSWAQHDKDQVDELFQDELQQAILLSKVELEKQTAGHSEHTKSEIGDVDGGGEHAGDRNNKKKGKGKNKGKTKSMSIEEFHHGSVQPEGKQDVENGQRRISGSGDDFFTEVATEAASMIKKDKLQEEYKKQYKVQAVLQAKHNTELESRDSAITELKSELAETQAELKKVKMRNKQLCFILGQGEMKEKAEILQQVDSLSQIKDELTAQVSMLTSDLEKERSKVHALQNEISKLKHKGK